MVHGDSIMKQWYHGILQQDTEFELSYFYLFPVNYPTDDDKLICYFTVEDQKGIVCIGSE